MLPVEIKTETLDKDTKLLVKRGDDRRYRIGAQRAQRRYYLVHNVNKKKQAIRFGKDVQQKLVSLQYKDVVLNEYDKELSKWRDAFTMQEAIRVSLCLASTFMNTRKLPEVEGSDTFSIESIKGAVECLAAEGFKVETLTRKADINLMRRYYQLPQKKKVILRPSLLALCALLKLIIDQEVKPYERKNISEDRKASSTTLGDFASPIGSAPSPNVVRSRPWYERWFA